jgi:four helix bundle protein
MFTHHKLVVYRKALEWAGSVERISGGWARAHSLVDHFRRASESIVLNIAEGARLGPGPAKVVTLDYASGSALEGAACLDIAEVKTLLPSPEARTEKRRLLEVTRMLIGLRKSWGHAAIHEESNPDPLRGLTPNSEVLFHHERLDVYRVGLELMRWLCSLPGGQELSDRTDRRLDQAATSLLLNIAEGKGRYSELDHHRFLEVAAAAAVKSAA